MPETAPANDSATLGFQAILRPVSGAPSADGSGGPQLGRGRRPPLPAPFRFRSGPRSGASGRRAGGRPSRRFSGALGRATLISDSASTIG
jgi:hypothetical protein